MKLILVIHFMQPSISRYHFDMEPIIFFICQNIYILFLIQSLQNLVCVLPLNTHRVRRATFHLAGGCHTGWHRAEGWTKGHSGCWGAPERASSSAWGCTGEGLIPRHVYPMPASSRQGCPGRHWDCPWVSLQVYERNCRRSTCDR